MQNIPKKLTFACLVGLMLVFASLESVCADRPPRYDVRGHWYVDFGHSTYGYTYLRFEISEMTDQVLVDEGMLPRDVTVYEFENLEVIHEADESEYTANCKVRFYIARNRIEFEVIHVSGEWELEQEYIVLYLQNECRLGDNSECRDWWKYIRESMKNGNLEFDITDPPYDCDFYGRSNYGQYIMDSFYIEQSRP